MGEHPRPHFFISRPDHSITPLIAVDELPDYVCINGVPAVMTQAETQAMMSLGVKERSLHPYDVQLLKPSSSESGTGPAISSHTNIDGTHSSTSHDTQSLASVEKHNKQMADNTGDSSSVEMIQRPDLEAGKRSTAAIKTTTHSANEDRKSADVEEWCQNVELNDDTIQAKIDAVVASNPQGSEEVKESLIDENPRDFREKAGLTPGKKVYCSHWIRTGECDFIQQGCLYKHEMPDDDTLNAIGIRTVPSWYIAAHPGKAHERRRGGHNAFVSHASKVQSTPFPGPASTSPHLLHTQRPPFHQVSNFNFSHKPNVNVSYSPRGFAQNFSRPGFTRGLQQNAPYTRVQELPDDPLPTWQNTRQGHAGQLQLVLKPLRLKSPGYNTCPYPLPAPTTASGPATPATEKPQVNLPPIWEPRPSKLANGLCRDKAATAGKSNKPTAVGGPAQATPHADRDGPTLGSSSPLASTARIPLSRTVAKGSGDLHVTQLNVDRATTPEPLAVKGTASINTAYPALKPSLPPSQPTNTTVPRLSSEDRDTSNSSDLFALAPKVPAPEHRRRFVPPGGERYKGPKVPEEDLKVREETGVSKAKEIAKEINRGESHAPNNQDFDKNKKKRNLSSNPRSNTKRAVRKHDQATELLVEYQK